MGRLDELEAECLALHSFFSYLFECGFFQEIQVKRVFKAARGVPPKPLNIQRRATRAVAIGAVAAVAEMAAR